MSEELGIDNIRDFYRRNFNKYTRKAFQTLPEIIKPKILDIGCGTGVGTLEIARVSRSKVIAIDIDEKSLMILERKIAEQNLMHQIQVITCSIHEMTFSHNSFDIIWMEGLQFINFKTRLNLCYPLLKPNGFLVIHDGQEGIEKKIKSLKNSDFYLYSRIDLPDNAWSEEYYLPLEKWVSEFIIQFPDESTKMELIDNILQEIEHVKNHPSIARSSFIILQKQ